MPTGEAPHSASAIRPNIDVFLPNGTEEKAPTPQAMTIDQIKMTISDYKEAARRARNARFDGVVRKGGPWIAFEFSPDIQEIHGANGYLVDQFLQDGSNQRKDQYGGSITNRVRFALEVVEAVIEGVGGESGRVGIRLAPWGSFGDMKESSTEGTGRHSRL